MRKRWWFAEILIGVYLTIGVLATGIGLAQSLFALQTNESAYDHQSGQAAEQPTEEISGAEWTAEERIADFTFWLTAFTFVLGVGTLFLWWETRKSGRLAREEFIATHRPRIAVRFIQEWSRDEGHDSVNVVIVNTGETTATVEGIGSDLARRNRKTLDWVAPGLRASVANSEPIEPFKLAGGEAHSWNVAARTRWGLADAFGDVELCAVGQIFYRDDNGVMRETGFFRIYDEAAKRFIPSSYSEDEYQD